MRDVYETTDPPMTLEYILPMNVRCRALQHSSRFQGFEHTTAALKTQFSPSSARYCGGEARLASKLIDLVGGNYGH